MTTTTTDHGAGRRWLPLLAACGFLLGFLAFSAAGGLVATDQLPLPDDPTSDVVRYYTDNPAAPVVSGLLMLASVAALLTFVRGAQGTIIRGGAATIAGWAAAVLLVASAGFGFALALFTPDLSDGSVELLRDANFYTGGALHVTALGLLALFICRSASDAPLGRGVVRFGYGASAVAIASLVSLPVYAASPLIPIGRLLVMVWAITAAVSALRATRPVPSAELSAQRSG